MALESYGAKRSRDGLSQYRDDFGDAATKEDGIRQKLARADDRREDFEENAKEWREGYGLAYSFLLLLPGAVWGLDFLLFGPSVTFLTARTSDAFASVSRALVPAFFVLFHLVLGFRIEQARLDARHRGRSRVAMWLLTAVLFNAAIAFLVVPPAQLADFERHEHPPEIYIPLLIATCLLALLGHGLVLFMGRPLIEAEKFATFHVIRTWLRSPVAWLHMRLRRAEYESTKRLRGLHTRLAAHKSEDQNSEVKFAPFSIVECRVIKRITGEEPVVEPAAEAPEPQPGDPDVPESRDDEAEKKHDSQRDSGEEQDQQGFRERESVTPDQGSGNGRWEWTEEEERRQRERDSEGSSPN